MSTDPKEQALDLLHTARAELAKAILHLPSSGGDERDRLGQKQERVDAAIRGLVDASFAGAEGEAGLKEAIDALSARTEEIAGIEKTIDTVDSVVDVASQILDAAAAVAGFVA
jgi:hypothetical protein